MRGARCWRWRRRWSPAPGSRRCCWRPFGELLLHSADLAERSGTGVDKHVDPTYLLGFFLYDYWGRATDTPLLLLLFSRSWYVGALPLMLAAAALVVRPRARAALDRRRRRRCCWR